MQTALALSRFASQRGVTQRIHIELESGLNRHGLPLDELVAFAESARALPGIEVEGLFTHFAAAEEGEAAFTRAQYDALHRSVGAAAVDPDPPLLRVSQRAERARHGAGHGARRHRHLRLRARARHRRRTSSCAARSR